MWLIYYWDVRCPNSVYGWWYRFCVMYVFVFNIFLEVYAFIRYLKSSKISVWSGQGRRLRGASSCGGGLILRRDPDLMRNLSAAIAPHHITLRGATSWPGAALQTAVLSRKLHSKNNVIPFKGVGLNWLLGSQAALSTMLSKGNRKEDIVQLFILQKPPRCWTSDLYVEAFSMLLHYCSHLHSSPATCAGRSEGRPHSCRSRGAARPPWRHRAGRVWCCPRCHTAPVSERPASTVSVGQERTRPRFHTRTWTN